MNKLFLLILLFCSLISFSQSKTELKAENESLKKQVETLTNELKSQKSENEQLKSLMISKLDEMSNSIKTFQGSGSVQNIEKSTEKVVEKSNTEKGQCKAITAAGTQCKRIAEEGSDYCWQHKGKQNDKANGIYDSGSTKINKSSGSSYGSGKTIQTGPRGGKYYINKNGNKTYIKR